MTPENADINISPCQTLSCAASIVLYELDTFNCLSLEAKQALERFINIKVDLLSRHPDKLGIKYAKQFSLRSDASCSFRSFPHPNAACKKWRFGALGSQP
ncbi:hypothetical protein PSTG_10640 [Puccinia striiformis f. sp. tritici PST-78]|uniref:Uncharacterized protein n=1 Tax=Puccinia striiformis f. sp. tritici PST-78 TaxID=1165861 RepID=A0A0L0VAR1_9BASI|nr:hypothetical protein PSTG_10640 [Puccinia striiformis f. sp. tritici PST-78]